MRRSEAIGQKQVTISLGDRTAEPLSMTSLYLCTRRHRTNRQKPLFAPSYARSSDRLSGRGRLTISVELSVSH